LSVIRTLASTENPLFSQASMSAAAAASRRRERLNHRITRRRTRSVSAVHGRTSADGHTLEDGRIEVGDLLATLAAAVGVKPETENLSEMGRRGGTGSQPFRVRRRKRAWAGCGNVARPAVVRPR